MASLLKFVRKSSKVRKEKLPMLSSVIKCLHYTHTHTHTQVNSIYIKLEAISCNKFVQGTTI